MSSQLPNSGIKKYSGALQELLTSNNLMELSQITPEHLDRFAAKANAHQRSQLLTLWSSNPDPSPVLIDILESIQRTR